MQINITDTPDQADVDRVTDKLKAHNRSFAKPDRRDLAVLIRDDDQVIVAALLGYTHWGCLRIDILWVSDKHRTFGLGRQLVDAAIAEAAARGCHNAAVETMAFQARQFYEKCGFEVFGCVDGGEPSLQCYYLKRQL